MLLGATGIKVARKYVGEIDPKAQGWAFFLFCGPSGHIFEKQEIKITFLHKTPVD